MTPIQKFKALRPAAQQIITSYLQRRGITSDRLEAFLQPELNLDASALPDVDRVITRLNRAIQNRERILIFGDYDADGITATAILLRCLREGTGTNAAWALPHREHDHYGLDLVKAKRLQREHQPSLLICLDNGGNSNAAIAWLNQQGVDTLVVDHHPFEGAKPDALALINPKAHGPDRNDLCAAGLTLLLCHELVRSWKAEAHWDQDAAIIFAGIATLADAVAMTPRNRALVKAAIHLMHESCTVGAIPGLAALLANQPKVAQRQLQFDVIPQLNAPGRLGDAEIVVNLLTTHDPATARAIAAHCGERNALRQQLQREVVRQAKALAAVVVNDHPDTPVLVLAERSWHHGVAGPAASQVAERFSRSVILLAPHTDEEWKGSGRSSNGDNLGQWISHVKSLGLATRGGGHAAAVGLAVSSAQLAPLQSAGLFLPMPQADHEPEQEVVGDMDALRPEEWATVIELLGPCGRKNPFPLISANGVVCQGQPIALVSQKAQKIWALKAKFKTNDGKIITVLWRDVEGARQQWTAGARCELTLELTAQHKADKTFYNWSVSSSRPARANNPKTLASSGGAPAAVPDGSTHKGK